MSWGIVGHEWATRYLARSIAQGRDSHAYLLSGPPAVGKRLLALRLGQALLCERAEDGSPCLACRACKKAASGNHPDLRVAGMDTQAALLNLKEEEAQRQKLLRIETIREFQRDITLKPYEARRRVFLLHDADRLGEQAANALLKTLEEPPPYAVLVLVADTAGELLPTVVSRCRPIRLRPLARAAITEALMARGLIEDDARLLAAWSGGRIGWALHALEHPEELEQRQERLDALIALPGQGRAARFAWAEERGKEYRSGEQQMVFAWLELWQGWWRDTLLLAAGAAEQLTHLDRRAELERLALKHRPPQAAAFIRRIATSAQQLRENANPQLVLENLVLHIP
jgi:DNA polymerase III subunit delta'